MNFLKKFFPFKKKHTDPYLDFWDWFISNEKEFYQVIKSNKGKDYLEKKFFKKISTKLLEIKDGIAYLCGIDDENNAELVLTPDGVVENIVFVEELVNAAPKINGWKFIALKPAIDISGLCLEISDFEFNIDNLSFYSTDSPEYPDEIDITLVYNNYSKEHDEVITNGAYLFLDNLLGELNFVTIIDNITVIHPSQASQKLIPLEKLNHFLIWRQKEFIEKYEATLSDTENHQYTIFKGKTKTGEVLIADIDSTLLQWDKKASHPWILDVTIEYDGSENNGLPDSETLDVLEAIEEDLLKELKEYEGYLQVGRGTGINERKIWFVCKEFRKPSKVLFHIVKSYSKTIHIDYSIYKDKYWVTFNRFAKHGI